MQCLLSMIFLECRRGGTGRSQDPVSVRKSANSGLLNSWSPYTDDRAQKVAKHVHSIITILSVVLSSSAIAPME